MKRLSLRTLNDDRGMTLAELMVALLVLSLVTGAILSLFMTSLQAYWKGDLATQVQQGGRVSTDRMTRDLRQARRLINGVSAGGFTFNTPAVCSTSPPQISFVLPHLALVTLQDNPTTTEQIYATDPDPSSGSIPYDGKYVSYYLTATAGVTTPNTAGPYLERTEWDISGVRLTTTTVAGNVTGLTFSVGGACPTTGSVHPELTVTVTASQTASGANVSSTDVNTSDVVLRNQ